MKPSVCVTIPVKNSENFIMDSVMSALSQNYSNLVVRVYDGESQDKTLNILKNIKDKRLIVYKLNDAGNACKAIKRAIEHPNEEIIIPLMSDDFFIANNIVSIIANEFTKNDIQFLYGNTHVVKRHDTKKIIRYVNPPEISFTNLMKGDHPHWSAVAFKKSLIESLNFNKHDYLLACDFDFYIQIFKEKKFKTRKLDYTFTKCRLGGLSTNSISSIYSANKEAFNAWKKNEINIRYSFLLSKFYRKLNEFKLKLFD
jgi:glycosyltransferase involved in cell wall biosynthesis